MCYVIKRLYMWNIESLELRKVLPCIRQTYQSSLSASSKLLVTPVSTYRMLAFGFNKLYLLSQNCTTGIQTTRRMFHSSRSWDASNSFALMKLHSRRKVSYPLHIEMFLYFMICQLFKENVLLSVPIFFHYIFGFYISFSLCSCADIFNWVGSPGLC